MSWALASFVGLGAALAVGFAWYERTRPSARLLSVVGTLAALAILGRIAFAPIPNVKPTTDIVLIAGYALGGAPGFAVGAVAALGSNLFFGEGPWTPWQMAAWGIVGIAGAGLARASGGRMGRWPLAIACALSGLLYGAILDLSTWVTGSGAHSLSEYLTISGVSLPFNIAHAVGNVVFFLAFGPALVGAVKRSRLRFDVAWQPLLLVGVLLLGAAAPRDAQAASPASRAAGYLLQARNADNGWGGAAGQSSNGLHTAWADYALAAAGRPQDSAAILVQRLGSSTDIGDIERTILALRACGADPRAAGGRDLVAELLARRRSDGDFGGYTSFTSYAILALQAAGETGPVAAAARWVERQQDRDGGFNLYRRGGASDADDTGYALEALAAAGRGRTAVTRRAVAFLRRIQQRDGGWAISAGAASNAQSTAFAVLGLRAAGASPAKVARHGRSGLDYLRALQNADGSVRYAKTSRQTPVWVTSQALLAFLQRPLPVVAPAARRSADAPAGWLGILLAAVLAL